jgi:hypothetical protein
MSFTSYVQRAISEPERLLLAMAPIDKVIDAFRSQGSREGENYTLDSEDENRIHEQDAVGAIVECWWTEFGPSKRYMKRLVSRYVNRLEKDGIPVESESLLGLILRVSLSKCCLPHPEETCYLAFQLPKTESLLRVRIFPYHNDVALRVWEAGAVLAEFLLHNPSVLAGKSVIEIGAGVGLTGLVVAGCCKPLKVHLTDYTYECRLNLDHNILINQDWISRCGFCDRDISQVCREEGMSVSGEA